MPKIVFKTVENIIYIGELIDSSNSEIRARIEHSKTGSSMGSDDHIPNYIVEYADSFRGTVAFNKKTIIWYYTYQDMV